MPDKYHLLHSRTVLTSGTYIIHRDNFSVFVIPVKDFKKSRYLHEVYICEKTCFYSINLYNNIEM